MKKQDKQSKSLKEQVLTVKQLSTLAREWQGTLSMCDWSINVSYAAPKELLKPGVIGQCGPDQEHKHAKIMMLHPKFYAGFDYIYKARDFEHTLVHEMLHAQFDCMDIPDMRLRELEQVINLTAEALLSLKYRDK